MIRRSGTPCPKRLVSVKGFHLTTVLGRTLVTKKYGGINTEVFVVGMNKLSEWVIGYISCYQYT